MKQLSLSSDFRVVYSYVAGQVRAFDPILTGCSLLSRIELGYSFYRSGWVVLHFDTCPDVKSDGAWSKYIEDNELYRRHWSYLCEANATESIEVVLPNG